MCVIVRTMQSLHFEDFLRVMATTFVQITTVSNGYIICYCGYFETRIIYVCIPWLLYQYFPEVQFPFSFFPH